MNTILTTPDVKLFVAAVREHLADLTEEEREELVGGLEGEMSDLVAERGVDALPEPKDYAEELRAAAGFDAERVRGTSVRHRVRRLAAGGAGGWARWRNVIPAAFVRLDGRRAGSGLVGAPRLDRRRAGGPDGRGPRT